MPEHFQTDAAGRRFIQTPEGPLGSGRLFQNPNLQTLDELQEAIDDPNRSIQGRRDVSAAFDKFSSFLDRQDAKEAARQAGRQRNEARELALQEKRDEASLRKEILSDPITSKAVKAARRASLILGGARNIPPKARERLLPENLRTPQANLPPELVELTNRSVQEFDEGIVQFQRDGGKISRQQFTALTNANRQANIASGQATAREEASARAEERTPEARREESFAFIEEQLGEKLNSAEKIRLSNPATAKDMIQELAERAEAKEGRAPDAPFALSPEGASAVATSSQIRAAAVRAGSTDAAAIEAELEKEGLRVQ